MKTFDDIMNTGVQKKVASRAPQSPPVPPLSVLKPTEFSASPANVSKPILPREQPRAKVEEPTVAPDPDVKADKPSSISYVDLFSRMNPPEFRSPLDIEQEKKKKKREAIFSAIGDGISSLSSLFFATKGAPPSYDASNSLSGALKRRYDELNDKRKSDSERWMNGYLRVASMDDANNRAERSWEHSLNREKILDERSDNEMKAKDADWADNAEYNRERIRKARSDADAAKVIADFTADKVRSEIDRNKASANASYHSAMNNGAQAKVVQDKNHTSVPSGTGGMIRIPNSNLNEASVSYVFNKFGVPDYIEVPTKNKIGVGSSASVVMNRVPLTTKQKLDYIGAHIEESKDAQYALSEISTGKSQKSTKKRVDGYGNGSGSRGKKRVDGF